MKTKTENKREGFEDWCEKKLPVPKDIKAVEEADRKWRLLKEMNGL